MEYSTELTAFASFSLHHRISCITFFRWQVYRFCVRITSDVMQCIEVLSEDQQIHDILRTCAIDAVREENNAFPNCRKVIKSNQIEEVTY